MVFFMGFVKFGKLIVMGEFFINVMFVGYNVLYFLLEVYIIILFDCFDVRLLEIEMFKLVEWCDEVYCKLVELGVMKGIGSLWVVECLLGSMLLVDLDCMFNSMKVNGMVFDMVVVDYVDLMCVSYDFCDDCVNICSIYIDLCVFYDKYNVVGIMVLQINCEGGVLEVVIMMYVVDNIEKVCIVDLVIMINKIEEEEVKGEVCFYFVGLCNQQGGISICVK